MKKALDLLALLGHLSALSLACAPMMMPLARPAT